MKYVLLIVLLFAFASCTSYRYIKLESADLSRNKDNGFIETGDSIEVNYHFYGSKGPVHLTIYNKMNNGLQVDLSRSALVLNDKAISLYSGDINISGVMHSNTIEWTKNISSTSGMVTARGSLPQTMLFIPAHAYIDITPITVTDQFFDTIPDSKYVKSYYLNEGDISSKPIKTARFGQAESPLVFKTYLSFMIPDGDQKEFVKQHVFYISEIVKAPFRPDEFGYMQSPNGDKFYVSHTKGAGVGAGILVATAVAASAAMHTGPTK